MVPCSSLTLTMFGREIRLCSEVSLLVVFGIFSPFEGELSACAVSVVLMVMVVIFSSSG